METGYQMNWPWQGVVAVILAITVGGSILALCLGAVLQDETISQQGADLISTTLGVAVGAVAVYLGGGRGTGTDE
jgi:hypothetical protein